MSSTFNIRPATREDVTFIVDLHQREHVRAFLDAPRHEQVEKAIDRGASQFIAERDGLPIGFVMLDYPEEWLVDFRRIAVREPGTGVGSDVMRWLLAHAFEERGGHRINLEVAATNTGARRLYERFGFVHEGTYRDGFRNQHTGAFEDLCMYGLLKTDARAT